MTGDPRERLLATAATLMHRRGYEAVGVAELCEVAEVKRGSFYHFFESKQALALAMLGESWERTRTTLFDRSISNESLPAVEAIQRYGELLAVHQQRQLTESDVLPGCRFGNFASELSTRDETIRRRVGSIFDEMIGLVEVCVERGVRSGELMPGTDARQVAITVIAQMEGLMVLAKAHRDPAMLATLGSVTRALIARERVG